MKTYSYILILFFISCNVRYVKIISVHDGDTITTSKGEKIRFSEIDAPEIDQPFGYEAKMFVSNLILNKKVKLVTHGEDKYGRTLADIYINGLYVNEAEIKAGFCWVYRRYSDNKYYLEELQAKRNKIGLWASNEQIPPFLYRKQSKK